ncbi:MAG: PAS domain S-box protein, partial [Microcystaceae cyanobacterium]
AEEALRHSEARFRRMVDSNIIGVLFCDTSGRIFDANDDFLAMVGYSQEDLHNAQIRWDTMTPPEYRHLDELAVQQLRVSGVAPPWEKEYIRKDGRRISVLLGGAMLEGPEEQVVSFVLNITERKQAETALRQSEATKNQILKAIPDLILQVTKDGTCLDCKFPKDSKAGAFVQVHQHLSEVLSPELLQRQLYYIERALTTGELQVYNHQLIKHGRIAYEELRIAAISETEVLLMVRDITDRKQAEVELRRQHRSAQLFAELALKIRRSLQLEEILQTTVTEVQQFLHTDRVLVFQLGTGSAEGTIVEETVAPGWPVTRGENLADLCLQEAYLERYR